MCDVFKNIKDWNNFIFSRGSVFLKEININVKYKINYVVVYKCFDFKIDE